MVITLWKCMKVYFERRILVGFIVAFAILALLGVYTYRYDRESRVTTMLVVHTNEVLFHIEQLNSTALRLEKELHEFALTGDTAFNSIYKNELLTAAHHAGMLSKLTSDNPSQLTSLDSVRLLGREKVGVIKKVIAAAAVSPSAMRMLIPSEENTRLSNLLAGVIGRMKDREKILLQHRAQATRESESKTMSTFILLQFASGLLLVLGFFAINFSFRKRMWAEQSLREASAEVHDLYNNAPCGYHSLDDKGIITEMNSTGLQWLGYTRDEIINNKHFTELLTPSSQAVFQNTFPLFKEQGYVNNVEFEMIRKNGETFPVIVSAAAMKNEHGEFVRSRSTVFDITERKKAEEKVKLLNSEMEAFTYSVSHDLRAPLRSIDGYARILKEDFGAGMDKEANRLMDVVMRNARRMGKLIDDMLDFSRVGRKDLSRNRIDVDTMVDSIRRELMDHERGRDVRFDIRPLASVEADNNLMRQVWINLISNALKYTSKNLLTEITIDSRQENGHVVYSIRDNGVGFDMKYANKLFGVFQRLHKIEEFDGTGVGLALVHRIVSRHGGKVWAESEVNKGATFSFYIPSETNTVRHDKQIGG
jgi:PAS domain S-box-containing protein